MRPTNDVLYGYMDKVRVDCEGKLVRNHTYNLGDNIVPTGVKISADDIVRHATYFNRSISNIRPHGQFCLAEIHRWNRCCSALW